MENNKIQGVELFTYKNIKNRFFVPSKENYFGGVKIQYIMFDTGCNTHLLPLEKDKINNIIELFPADKYVWQISGSKGTGALSPPVLIINSINGKSEMFNVKISCDLYPFETFLEFLRFHLSYEDTVDLFKCSDFVSLSSNSKLILNNFIKTVESLKNIYPDIKIGERRSHALFGQNFMNKKQLLQKGNVSAVLSQDFNFKDVVSIYGQLEIMGKKAVEDIENFDDLEDEDHDATDLFSKYFNILRDCRDE